MFQMPTGTGKTVVFNQIVKQELEKNSTVLILAHRQELIEQNIYRLRVDFQIEAGMIMGDNPVNLNLPVQVASIQTLSKRDYPSLNPSLIIIDEAHHVVAASYVKLLSEYPDARILGVTASPIRLSGEGFTDSFDTLITSKSVAEFIQDGYLAPIRYLGKSKTFSKVDLSGVSIVEGDYAPSQLSKEMRDDVVMANLIKSYINHAQGRKMIVFAVDRVHSKDITKRYQDEGFVAAHLDAKTTPRSRKEIINKFKNGEIQILSNVNIVSEGFDVPDCEVVQLARPTKSLSMYLQQVGRCMRKPEGKDYCIVLDNVGLYEKFGSPRNHREWTLEATVNSTNANPPPITDTTPSSDNPQISSSSSKDPEPLARTKPEETDEDLIVLEDVNMPIESEKVSKLLSEIDDQLTELSTDNSDILDVLQTVKDNIENFLNLSCYDLLSNVPNPLSISHFVVSKNNSLKLAGQENLFRECNFVADFTIPEPLKQPQTSDYDFSKTEDALKFANDYQAYERSGKPFNDALDKLQRVLDDNDIVRKYANLRRAVNFVRSHDPSEFIDTNPLTLEQLPPAIKTAILTTIRASFAANPYIKCQGELIPIPSNCNLDTKEGIDSLIGWRKDYKYSKYEFYSKKVYLNFMEQIWRKANCFETLHTIAASFDVDFGSSKNTSTIMANLKKLM
ncbi:DEAD/DEAH box helicase [Pseudanabaena sp. FACHB-723]|uniref:DEAD/DEAH box helicase n=2 Tax=Pseudanabaena mucicola TaxID=71190 RepID=A0ABR7ZZ34_9CYAN|nr:DEAD/DEAH box helicase [Pseudanabaena mucicola FACHB-723]